MVTPQTMIDPAMPALSQALDAIIAEPLLQRAIAQWRPAAEDARLESVRLLRHKPGRRALIEYELSVNDDERLTLLGKIRAKGLDRKTPKLMVELAKNGFGANSHDGIAVPEVIGEIPELQLWLQAKVPGVPVTHWLAGADGVAMVERVAVAAHKIHRAGVRPSRRHTVDDELRILEERLGALGNSKPEWNARLKSLLTLCREHCEPLRSRPTCGVHRDFYPAQLLVDGARLWLLDFDLYCESDPALDIGNFLGHITEQALRETGNSAAMKHVEEALVAAYVSRARGFEHYAIATFHTLTLVRHISISTQFPDRRHTTEALLKLCEQRLG